MTESATGEFAAWATDQLGALTVAAHDAILARVPAYAKEDPVPESELVRSIKQNLIFMIGAIGHDSAATLDMATPSETGRRRALAAMPLPEVLRAYRLVFRELWDELVRYAQNSGRLELIHELPAVASQLWQRSDEHAVAVTEAYRATTAELLLRDQRRRSALVEALFTGAASSNAWEAASLLGLPPDADFVVVAAETTALAEESLRNIEQLLAERRLASAWRLTPALQVGIVALPDHSTSELLGVLRSATRGRTGISPPYRSIADTQRALLLARAAISTLPPGRPGIHVFSSSPLAAMMACEPAAAARLTADVLGRVLALPDDDRDILLTTLHGYLDHGGSAELAGEALHCHPNTIRYRLRRLAELTGRSLQEPYATSELAAASYAVRIHPDRQLRGRREHDRPTD